MSIKINYKKSILSKSATNLVLFVDENFNIKDIKKYISNSEFSYISDLLKNSDLKIKTKKGYTITSRKTIEITVPFESIDGVSLAGSGDVFTNDVIKSNNLKFKTTPSGPKSEKTSRFPPDLKLKF